MVKNQKEQSWRQQRRVDPTTRSKVNETKKKSRRPRHRRGRRPFWVTNFGNWIRFEAPLPKDKDKEEEEKRSVVPVAPRQECANCMARTEKIGALTQDWAAEKMELQRAEQLLQEQVASLQQQLRLKEKELAQAKDTNPAQVAMTLKKAVTQEKTEPQVVDEFNPKQSDATEKEKTRMTRDERLHYEKMKKRAERFGVPLSAYWNG